MTEKYTIEQHEEYRRQQDEKAAQEQRDLVERTEKAAARSEYLRGGGTEQEFEAAWPGIRQEQLRKRAISVDEQARAATRSLGISSI